MKKFISPVLVFAAVFVICCAFLPYTIICRENFGLFLNTPDYFRTMFSGSLPVCNIIADFAAQFFRYKFIGPAIIAGITTATFLLLRFCLSRFGLRADSACALIAGAAFFSVADGKLQIGIFVLLISACAAFLSMIFLKKREKKSVGLLDTILAAVAIAAVCLFICFNPSVKRVERWSKIEYGSYVQDWDLVIKTATPERCEKDRMMIPFALLAHNCKGELADKMFRYPIVSEEDLSSEGVNSFQGYFFAAMLYRELGSPNEAVHQLFQASTTFRHTSCFLELRELISNYYQMGNYTLARKYCGILAKSSCHKRYVEYFTDLMAGLEDVPANNAEENSLVGQISHVQASNILILSEAGINSKIAAERYLCHLLAQKDLTAFSSAFSIVADYYATVPRYFQEALAVLGAYKDKISTSVIEQYAAIALGQEVATEDTYWYYLNR